MYCILSFKVYSSMTYNGAVVCMHMFILCSYVRYAYDIQVWFRASRSWYKYCVLRVQVLRTWAEVRVHIWCNSTRYCAYVRTYRVHRWSLGLGTVDCCDCWLLDYKYRYLTLLTRIEASRIKSQKCSLWASCVYILVAGIIQVQEVSRLISSLTSFLLLRLLCLRLCMRDSGSDTIVILKIKH